MTETLRLGSIAGIRIGVNWTVLVIFGLLVVGLGLGRYPAAYSEEAVAAHLLAAVLTGLVFFASLLAHEMAHAIVARRNGLRVEGITLWLFGGVARLAGDVRTPGADIRVAGVGPLVSLLLGAGFYLLELVSDGLGLPGLVGGSLGWLAVINVVLAVFNLAPAAPLDGGRILRGVVWAVTGDRVRSVVVAARAGRVFGFVLIVLGIAQALMLPGLGGLWLALIGWFIVAAAGAEEQQAVVGRALAGLRVRDIASGQVVTVPVDLTVDRFIAEYALVHPYSTFPLVDERGDFVGLATLNRIKQVPVDHRPFTRMGDVACPPGEVATADLDEPLASLLPRLTGCSDNRAVVLAGGRPAAVVSPRDIARALERSELRGIPPVRV